MSVLPCKVVRAVLILAEVGLGFLSPVAFLLVLKCKNKKPCSCAKVFLIPLTEGARAHPLSNPVSLSMSPKVFYRHLCSWWPVSGKSLRGVPASDTVTSNKLQSVPRGKTRHTAFNLQLLERLA